MSDHSPDHSPGAEPPHDEHDHGGVGKYIAVFVALLVLTAISFAVGSNETIMATPAIGWTLMMAVSCAKALLVMLFFMHLIWEANWKYVLTIPASIMSVFLLLMLFPDIRFRTAKYAEERWLHAATPQEHSEEHGAEDHGADSPDGARDDAGH
jgi:cytochrome c oxidase subunit 4